LIFMRSLLVYLCALGALVAADRPAFFAMDTAARLQPAECAAVLAELGYAGLGGRPATAKAHAAALQAKGLAFFNGYHVADFASGQDNLPPELTKAVDDLAGTGGTLWLAISKVELPLGLRMPPEYGDTVVVPQLRQLVAYAQPKGVKISLYPHAGFWAARFETCVRVASKVDDPALGVTFNLCHWLKVEGSERDPAPLIKEALPRLNFITINGADTGDTQNLGWDKLIQPLGRGTYDVGAFVAKARAAGYRGPFGFQGYGIKMEPKELLKETMEGWKRSVK
jgi:sugar phosphate isomerase/epimerase